MTLGTHLTIRDYLGTQKGVDTGVRKLGLLKRMNFSGSKGFTKVLSSCLAGRKAEGMTAADYLSSPVKVKKATIMKCTETPLAMRQREIGSTAAQSDLSHQLLKAQNKMIESSEEPLDAIVMEAIEKSIDKAALKYNLSPDLIRAVIKAESDFQVKAESSAGARGLMQLMPATAKELGVKDLFDIDQNIDGGTRYLRSMLDRFENDIRKALAAYNAGPGTVERFGGRVPPYRETRDYVERVLRLAGQVVA